MAGFLDLSTDVRRTIYVYAGLVRRDCPIDLSIWAAMSARTEQQRNEVRDPAQPGCWRNYIGLDRNPMHFCACEPLPAALLRVCRLVHAEAVAVLYGQNRFILRVRTRTRPRQPPPVFRCWKKLGIALPPPARQLALFLDLLPRYGLAHMTALVLRLNCWPCVFGHDEVLASRGSRRELLDRAEAKIHMDYSTYSYDDSTFGTCIFCSQTCDSADEPLCLPDASMVDPAPDTVEAETLALLATWDRVCERLGGALRWAQEQGHRRQLDLAVVCDTDSAATATRVLAPLTQHLPPASLANCTLRLGRHVANHAITRVAMTASQYLMANTAKTDHSSSSSAPPVDSLAAPTAFPFRRLPTELRIHVLRFTDLGTRPDSRDGDKCVWIHNGRLAKNDDQYTEPDCMDDVDSLCCGTCMPSHSDCACTPTHASVAPRCRCRRLGGHGGVIPALFLVDRQMYAEAALDVFYANTTFKIDYDIAYGGFAGARIVLSRMTPAALRTIRHLHIVPTVSQLRLWMRRHYPLEDPDNDIDVCHPEGRRGDHGWPGLVRFIDEHMDVPQLHLTVDVGVCVQAHILSEFQQFGEDELEVKNQLLPVYVMALDLATPLCALGPRLANFRFELGTYDNLARWIEREVVGDTKFHGTVLTRAQERVAVALNELREQDQCPSYHHMNQRMSGSNYHPSP